MTGPRTRTPSPGDLVAPGVLASIVRDYVKGQQETSKERGTSRIDEAGHLVLLRDATALAAMGGE